MLDWGCRKGIASESEMTGAMRLTLAPALRERLIDSLDRLSGRYPNCIRRVEATAWMMPCPRCGRPGYGVVVM